jgi:hypothetical protein
LRLWSIHPKYLDTKGLVACWRESLLAKKVIEGQTKGYKFHPQLKRFLAYRSPVQAIDQYLTILYNESLYRGFLFDKSKLGRHPETITIPLTSGQLLFEFEHLKSKLWQRDRKKYFVLKKIKFPECNPLFSIIDGEKDFGENL